MDDTPGVPDHKARLRLKPFVKDAPDPARRMEVDPDRLESAIAALTASVRNGTKFDPRRLMEAGLPGAVAERIARKARTAS